MCDSYEKNKRSLFPIGRVHLGDHVVRHGHQGQLLVAASMIQVRPPANALDPDVLSAVFINARTSRVQRIVVWNAELAVPAVDGDAHP